MQDPPRSYARTLMDWAHSADAAMTRLLMNTEFGDPPDVAVHTMQYAQEKLRLAVRCRRYVASVRRAYDRFPPYAVAATKVAHL